MGVVFRAREETLGREVALKVIAPHYAHDPEFRGRFIREAQSQASLESTHVVAVYAHGEEDGHLYIASQLVIDGDLGHLLKRVGLPPLSTGLAVIEQVASGLSDAHEAGLVHRDIKPGNVLVRLRNDRLQAYLCDFGIARQMNGEVPGAVPFAIGTPSYMAPELHSGAPAGVQTDIYSLGCLLWVTLTGTEAFQGPTEPDVIAAHLHAVVPQLPGSSAMVNATNRILRIAMAKDPQQRYQTAAAMRDDIQAALRPPPAGVTGAGVPPIGPTGYAKGDAGEPSRRRRRLAWAAAGTAAVAAIAIGVVAALASDNKPTPPEPVLSAAEQFLALPPKEIVNESQKELAVLTSARVRGNFQTRDAGVMTVDLVATSIGDCRGTMSLPSGASTKMLSADGRVYIKPSANYLDESLGGPGESTPILSVLGDRWLLEESLSDSLTEICDLDRFFERDGRENAVATLDGTEEVDGNLTAKVTQAAGSQSETLYVQVAEPHYLLKLVENSVDNFLFSEFDAPVTIETPADDDVFDLDKWLKRKRG